MKTTDVVIIGGGLAGLACALQLVQQDLEILVVEKKEYPFHRVCGEYISNEAKPFLKRLGVFPKLFDPPRIDRLLLTSTKGAASEMDLSLGGFGISRYHFDDFLHQEARRHGVQFITRKYVQSIAFQDDRFQLELSDHRKINCVLVIGCFGKRSVIDKVLDRSFISKRSPYLGVKYHLKGKFPRNLIALHNFQGGYAGVSTVENNILNLCYLAPRNALKNFGDIREMEKHVLMKNPFLERILQESELLFDQPEVINEISFESKFPVEEHILMCGDAAGMIAPLCGNGMAMAMHSSSLLTPLIARYFRNPHYSRSQLEQHYRQIWNDHFKRRLWTGRKIQNLFGGERVSSLAVNLTRNVKPVARFLVKQTHGRPF